VDQATHPDNRKTLSTLRSEWKDCTKCELGKRRKEVGGSFVFGEGAPRGVMFIGDGPGVEEEEKGRPFVGRSGIVLRKLIKKLGLAPVYISNVVACRSCGQAYDSDGNPRTWKDRDGFIHPSIKDMLPTPFQMGMCLPRLYEEIYLVDPVLIVALGGASAEILSGKASSILAESGVTRAISIPGAGYHPVVTTQRRHWIRKVRGETIMPVEQNQVNYLMMTLVHPAYVLQKSKDERIGNPVEIFLEGMQKAAAIYDRYAIEVHGTDLQIGSEQLDEEDFHEVSEEE